MASYFPCIIARYITSFPAPAREGKVEVWLLFVVRTRYKEAPIQKNIIKGEAFRQTELVWFVKHFVTSRLEISFPPSLLLLQYIEQGFHRRRR